MTTDDAPRPVLDAALRVVSYGGGVQSTALLVLAAQGRIDFRCFLFCNVGADSEHPKTLLYVAETAQPYAERHGLDFHWLHRERRAIDPATHRRLPPQPETLLDRLTRPGSRSIPLPVRMSGSGAPGTRSCTADFKIRLMSRWLREHGVTAEQPADVALGISLDEFSRARTDSGEAVQHLVYPLLDLRLRREDCERIILDAGLPVPPKSACWFCPFHTLRAWDRMRREEPDLFWRAVELERTLNERRRRLGKDPVWFTDRLRPLDEVVSGEQLPMFGEEELGCLSGYCAA